jgi:D-serine deaminase-like pyridoxal phosphate-dependent protein
MMSNDQFQKTAMMVVAELAKVFGEERVFSALGTLMQSVQNARATVDENVETILALANLPSRREVRRIERKLESVERALMNLNRKLDRITTTAAQGSSAETSAGSSPGPSAAGPGAAGHSTSDTD